MDKRRTYKLQRLMVSDIGSTDNRNKVYNYNHYPIETPPDLSIFSNIKAKNLLYEYMIPEFKSS